MKTFVIGFTGTIASGKTVRCHRLLQVALKHQLDTLRVAPKSSKAYMLSVDEALQAASLTVSDREKLSASSTSYLSLLQNSLVSVKHINADLLGHAVYLPGTPCYHQLIQRFGEGILAQGGPWHDIESVLPSNSDYSRNPKDTVPSCTNTSLSASLPPINRSVLGSIVFSDPQKLSELNAICWPSIQKTFQTHYHSCVSTAKSDGKRLLLLVLEAALLLEIPGMLSFCTDVWLTSCDEAVATMRLAERNGLTAVAAARRLAAQSNLSKKMEALRRVGFCGGLVHFDTSETTLAEGLRQVDVTFENYWHHKIKPFL